MHMPWNARLILGLYFSAFVFCIPQLASAQAPGYTGKRLMLALNSDFFPALGSQASTLDRTFNTRWGIEGRYVLSRQVSIGVKTDFFRNAFSYNFPFANDTLKGQAQLSGMGIGVFARLYSFFQRGHIAPIGFYQQISFSYMPYRLIDLNNNLARQNVPNWDSYRDLFVTYSIGRLRVIHPRLIYHIGLTGGWALNLFRPRGSFLTRELKMLSTERLREVSFINISMGLGFLID